MTRVRSLSVAALLLLGAAMLPGCSYDPDAAARAEAQSHRTAPAPGGFAVHMDSAVTSEAVVSH
jgi:hypothetical protein